jgi:hypothetical protein
VTDARHGRRSGEAGTAAGADRVGDGASGATSRRALLRGLGQGLGGIALATLLADDARAAGGTDGGARGGGGRDGAVDRTARIAGDDGRGLPGLPHHAPRARRVVCLWQGGGPSHVDLFDEKLALARHRGADIPASVRGGTRLSTMSSGYTRWPATPAIAPFARCGQSGMPLSTLLPHTGQIADRICLLRAMHTEAVNHSPGVTYFLTGSQQPGRPALGAWLDHGLGRLCDDLPAYVALTSSDRGKTCGQLFYEHYWSNGFLPGRHQGVRFRSGGDPVPYLGNPPGVTASSRRALLQDLDALDRARFGDADAPTQSRRAQYEMAFAMQASVPGLLDFGDEPAHVLAAYGPDVGTRGTFAWNCLLARRLLERGVRFVQLMHSGWDQHGNLYTQLAEQCRDTDQPSAALVSDLEQRGLLDDTLVMWGGEFGRTPFGQGPSEQPNGRDHFGRAFAWWLAGGGVRPGHVHGATDDFGWNIVDGGVHVHDLQATVLWLCGIDHERLTFRHQGRDFRLTDVHGKVVRAALA